MTNTRDKLMTIEYERQLLRLITLYPKTILDCGNLRPSNFSTRHYAKIFEVVSELYDNGKEISLTGVGVAVDEDWASDTLMSLASVRVDGGAKSLSESIVDASMGRDAVELLLSYKAVLENGRGRCEAISGLVEALGKLAQNKAESRLTTADLVAVNMLDILRNPDTQRTGVKTGIHKLDEHTGGVQNGLLTIVSGVPSMGKSTLLANMIMNQALAGEYVYISSLEDRDLFVVGRMISRLSKVNSESINKCQNIGLNELHDIEAAVERNHEALARIHIDDSSGQNVLGIRRTCSMLQSDGKLDVSYIDHLGELSRGNRSKYDAATANAEGLRDLANDLCIPVVSGAQVARSAVSGAANGGDINHLDCIPRAHHLRDSGRIEEVARNIWFVHRPYKWNTKENESDFWINIDKATHGKPKIIKLKTRLETMSIMDEDSFYE